MKYSQINGFYISNLDRTFEYAAYCDEQGTVFALTLDAGFVSLENLGFSYELKMLVKYTTIPTEY